MSLKQIAARLPLRHQQQLKRLHFARQLRRGTFVTNEKEFARLGEWVRPGDWVLDVGANVGHYSCRLSELVGPTGRVISFEPMRATFELLAANALKFPYGNITLLNVAASEQPATLSMALPQFASGLDNYYMAHVTADGGGFSVMALPIDALKLPRPVRLAKLDVEGHELSALKGMRELLARDKPVLIVEGRSPEVAAFLATFGYEYEEAQGSPNRVYSVKR